jgi:hypothetical protein
MTPEAGMTATKNDWEQFCKRASVLMRDALHEKEGLAGRRPLHRKTTFGRVVDFFENNVSISDVKLRDDIFNLLMEVGGSGPKYYTELLELFESGASEDELKQYFDY